MGRRSSGRVKNNLVPLSDGAGEVVAVGADVGRVKIGDRVAANCLVHWIGGPKLDEYQAGSIGISIDGMLAEYVVLHENCLVHLPAYMSYVEAASLPCAAVSAWSALHVGPPLTPGQTVLVQGTGGVSLFALQIARLFGARVLAITSTDEKAEILKGMGAESVVNYRVNTNWHREILKLTEDRGVDKVIEIGGETTIEKSAASAKINGSISVLGFVGGQGGGLSPVTILQRSLTVTGIGIGSRGSFETLIAAMTENKVRPVIDKVFPFSEYRCAFDHLKNMQHIGKVVIEMSG